MTRWVARVIGIGVLAVAVVIGLTLGGIYLFACLLSDPVPQTPPHPVVVGVRAEKGHLWVSTGRPCPAGTRFDVTFNPYEKPDDVPLEFTMGDSTATFDVTALATGFTVEQPLPAGYDWKTSPWIYVETQPGGRITTWVAATKLDDLTSASARHPEGSFYFGEAGWITPEEVAARDGKDLLTICTPR